MAVITPSFRGAGVRRTSCFSFLETSTITGLTSHVPKARRSQCEFFVTKLVGEVGCVFHQQEGQELIYESVMWNFPFNKHKVLRDFPCSEVFHKIVVMPSVSAD